MKTNDKALIRINEQTFENIELIKKKINVNNKKIDLLWLLDFRSISYIKDM